jgi:hypothetical protein
VTAIETLETGINLFANTLSFMRVAAFSLNHVALALAIFTWRQRAVGAPGTGSPSPWAMWSSLCWRAASSPSRPASDVLRRFLALLQRRWRRVRAAATGSAKVIGKRLD